MFDMIHAPFRYHVHTSIFIELSSPYLEVRVGGVHVLNVAPRVDDGHTRDEIRARPDVAGALFVCKCITNTSITAPLSQATDERRACTHVGSRLRRADVGDCLHERVAGEVREAPVAAVGRVGPVRQLGVGDTGLWVGWGTGV